MLRLFRFVMSTAAAFLVLAGLFAGFCVTAGHSAPEMLYGASATVTLSLAIGLLAAWRYR